MIINDVNYFDEHGNEVMSVGQGVDFCNSSDNKMTVVAPLVIYPHVKIDAEFIGKYAFINTNSSIRYVKRIGRYCSIASNTEIGCPIHPIDSLSSSNYYYVQIWNNLDVRKNDYHFSTPFNDNFHKKNEEVTIGNDVWIGAGAKIMRSINIGDGAVIGAGAVVTKDVEPYTIVGGVPAKIIRKRFPDDIIERLLKIRWWDYSPELVCEIDISNVTHELLDELERRIESGMAKDDDVVCFEFDPKTRSIRRYENGYPCVIYMDNKIQITHGGLSGGSFFDQETKQLFVKGWYLPVDAYDQIVIEADGKYIGEAKLGLERKDVETNYRYFKNSLRSGFSLSVTMSTASSVDHITITALKGLSIVKQQDYKINNL